MDTLLDKINFVHTIYTLKTSDGLELFTQIWKPEKEIIGVINLIHGIGEHSSRYDCWAKRFVNEGFAVVSFDLRGHGKSQGKKGHIPNIEQLLQDVDYLLDFSEKELPNKPTFIYGHSMGGNIVLNYIIKRNKNIKAAIVTSPWLKLIYPPSKIAIFLAEIVANFFPSFTQSTSLNSSYISNNKKEIDKYSSDTLTHNKISVKLFTELKKAGDWILKNSFKYKTPLLLMHGTDDKITSHEASIEFKNKNPQTELKLWKGYYHELHNENNCCEVFEYQKNWLLEKLKP